MRKRARQLATAGLAVVLAAVCPVASAGPIKPPPPIPLTITIAADTSYPVRSDGRIGSDGTPDYVDGLDLVSATLTFDSWDSLNFETSPLRSSAADIRAVTVDFEGLTPGYCPAGVCRIPPPTGPVQADVYAYLFKMVSTDPSLSTLTMDSAPLERSFYIFWPRSSMEYRLEWYPSGEDNNVARRVLVSCVGADTTGACNRWQATTNPGYGYARLYKYIASKGKSVKTYIGTYPMAFSFEFQR